MERSRPRILVIDNSVAVTGALISALRSSTSLSHYFDFHFMLPSKSAATSYVEKAGFSAVEFPMRELSRRPVSWLVYFPALLFNTFRFRAHLRRNRVNLVVANDFYNLLPAVSLLTGGRTPYVTYVRFMPDRFPSALVWFWVTLHYALAGKVIAVSNAVRSQLKPNPKLTVIYNELPSEEFTEFIKPANHRLLFLANVIPGKGQEIALRSFARLKDKFKSWRLRFVGGDMNMEKNVRFRAELQRLGEELGLGSQVEWIDFTSDVKAEYLASGIVLNLSDSESFSLTCLEAMYFGRCVLATRSGGPQEMLDNGVTGILISKGDDNELTTQLERLMSDESLRTQLGKNAFFESRKRFNVRETVAQVMQVYLNSIAGIKT